MLARWTLRLLIAAAVIGLLILVQPLWRLHGAIAVIRNAGGEVFSEDELYPEWSQMPGMRVLDAWVYGVGIVQWPEGPSSREETERLLRATAVLTPKSHLWIYGCSLDESELHQLAANSTVRMIGFSNCDLPRSPLKPWATRTSPTLVQLTEVRCPGDLLCGLGTMSSLRMLNLERVELTTDDLKQIRAAPRLLWLQMKSVGLPGEGMLPASPTGRTLYIEDTPFEPQDLHRWPQLKMLKVDEEMAPLVYERGYLSPEVRLDVRRREDDAVIP